MHNTLPYLIDRLDQNRSIFKPNEKKKRKKRWEMGETIRM